jgi:hypothetical protein
LNLVAIGKLGDFTAVGSTCGQVAGLTGTGHAVADLVKVALLLDGFPPSKIAFQQVVLAEPPLIVLGKRVLLVLVVAGVVAW